MSLPNIAEIVGAVVAIFGLLWGFLTYGLDRIVGVRVKGKSERRSVDGIRVEIANKSRKRDIQVKDVEVLHSRGWFRRRASEAAGPGLEPTTPWKIAPDEEKDGWVRLTAVDGSRPPTTSASEDFAKPVKLRVKLAPDKKRTSRRFRVDKSGQGK